MRYLKAVLIGATGLFVFITLLSLLITSHPKVSRTVVINGATPGMVYEQVADLKNWKNWHPLFASDSAGIVFGAIKKGPNASCDITYNNKTTHLEIEKADSTGISFLLLSKGENSISNTINLEGLSASAQTKADWVATTHLHWYPWEKFYAIFIDKLTGPGYEASLNGLKVYFESKQ